MATTTSYADLEAKYILTERCKAIALEFCAHLNERRFDLMAEMFTPDAQWRVNAREDRVIWGGSALASTRAIYAGQFLARLEVWSHTVKNVIADGELVVTKGVTNASGPGKAKYDNTLSMHFSIDATTGKIRDFMEFMDCYEIEEWIKTMGEGNSDEKKDVVSKSVEVNAAQAA